jgi:S-adenosyl-L-methionine hydrolase (adenosine-forming)
VEHERQDGCEDSCEILPVITLTTDFGTGSPYVAAMKARLLAGCPDASLVDVSHSVRSFDVRAGAFVLWAGTRDFAPGSVHLAVVDPGVGGPRRPLAIQVNGSWYVGPDNGLFGMVLDDTHESGTSVVAVELRRPPGASATFEGRDVFAPAAAALAAGAPATALGAPLEGSPTRLPAGPPSVIWVDNFGNLVTSLRPPVGGIRVAGREVRTTARTYSEALADEPFFYVGSMGFIEVGIREASAAQLLGAGPGVLVEPL